MASVKVHYVLLFWISRSRHKHNTAYVPYLALPWSMSLSLVWLILCTNTICPIRVSVVYILTWITKFILAKNRILCPYSVAGRQQTQYNGHLVCDASRRRGLVLVFLSTFGLIFGIGLCLHRTLTSGHSMRIGQTKTLTKDETTTCEQIWNEWSEPASHSVYIARCSLPMCGWLCGGRTSYGNAMHGGYGMAAIAHRILRKMMFGTFGKIYHIINLIRLRVHFVVRSIHNRKPHRAQA